MLHRGIVEVGMDKHHYRSFTQWKPVCAVQRLESENRCSVCVRFLPSNVSVFRLCLSNRERRKNTGQCKQMFLTCPLIWDAASIRGLDGCLKIRGETSGVVGQYILSSYLSDSPLTSNASQIKVDLSWAGGSCWMTARNKRPETLDAFISAAESKARKYLVFSAYYRVLSTLILWHLWTNSLDFHVPWMTWQKKPCFFWIRVHFRPK